MLLTSWLRSRNDPAPAAGRRPQTRPRPRAGFRPRLEALEERTVPASYTAGDARELIAHINTINNAGGSHTIVLAPGATFALGRVNNTTDGANGLPVIGRTRAVDLTIAGNGRTIERVGSKYFRLFAVAPGASLTLDSVTLRGGRVDGGSSGGAIYNRGTLTLTGSTVSGNTAESSGRGGGGGIYNAGGTVTVSASTITGNSAPLGYGGGVYNAWGGTVTVTDNSLLHRNLVTKNGYNLGGHGGGLYNAGTVTVMNSSSITNNSADWANRGSHGDDVDNFGVVYLDNTSTLGWLRGNLPVLFDPNVPPLRILDAAVTEGNTGGTSVTFTVVLSNASTQTITVAYATADGTAVAGTDYSATSGTLTFAPGETTKTVTVLANGDRIAEPAEAFFVDLSSPTNATVFGGRGVGTILDDEPRISIGDVTKAEGKNGQKTQFTFTVSLSVAYDQAVTVSFRTLDGTAKAGEDYVAKSGTLTFAPGETTKTVTIEVKGDATMESDETFYLDLFGPSSSSLLADSLGLGTILNDD